MTWHQAQQGVRVNPDSKVGQATVGLSTFLHYVYAIPTPASKT